MNGNDMLWRHRSFFGLLDFAGLVQNAAVIPAETISVPLKGS
jgi:hypothetical protein